jgi:hypothetical protein
MKTALAILGQFLLFLIFLGVFFSAELVLHLLHVNLFYAQWFVSHPTPTTVRFFVPTGLIVMTILYLVVFGIEAAVKKIRTAGLWTSIAFLLALVIGLVSKFGWVQPS